MTNERMDERTNQAGLSTNIKERTWKNRDIRDIWIVSLLCLFIFGFESLIMYVLGYVVILSPLADIFVDSSSLLLALSPLLFFLFRLLRERTRVEHELQEERDRFKAIFEATGDGVRIIDTGSKTDGDTRFDILMANSEMAELTGIPAKRQAGMKCYECLDGELCHTRACTLRRILDGEPVIKDEVLRFTPGKEIWLNHVATPIKDTAGNVVAVIEAFRDVTDRRRAEERLRQTNEELQSALRELSSTQAKLLQQEKLASIGQLAAGIAHEMNNPAGFVSTNFGSLREYTDDLKRLLNEYRQYIQGLDETGTPDRNGMERIRQVEEDVDVDFILEDLDGLFEDTAEGLGRLSEIIQNLRDFSRVDQIGDYTECNINDGIKSTLVIAKNEYKYHSDVKTELGDIPAIYCHPGQLNQVFMNIIVNAAQAIKGMNRPRRGNILIRTYADKDWVYCEISDDGPGIPEEIRGKVFDPFFTTKEVGKGTGLGLNISYDIVVNKHKGDIWVESKPGEGTKFVIKLPISKPEG